MTDTFAILGHERRGAISADELETFPTPAGCDRVVFVSDELTAFCPVTGQPDFYGIEVVFTSPTQCVESKSLKLYLQSFRDVGAFAEALAAQIADDVQRKTGGWVSVRLAQQVRGGLQLTASASAPRGEEGF